MRSIWFKWMLAPKGIHIINYSNGLNVNKSSFWKIVSALRGRIAKIGPYDQNYAAFVHANVSISSSPHLRFQTCCSWSKQGLTHYLLVQSMKCHPIYFCKSDSNAQRFFVAKWFSRYKSTMVDLCQWFCGTTSFVSHLLSNSVVCNEKHRPTLACNWWLQWRDNQTVVVYVTPLPVFVLHRLHWSRTTGHHAVPLLGISFLHWKIAKNGGLDITWMQRTFAAPIHLNNEINGIWQDDDWMMCFCLYASFWMKMDANGFRANCRKQQKPFRQCKGFWLNSKMSFTVMKRLFKIWTHGVCRRNINNLVKQLVKQ